MKFYWNWQTEDPQWSILQPVFRRYRLVDGTLSTPGEPIAHRCTDGVWQYRKLTEDEYRDFLARDAW